MSEKSTFFQQEAYSLKKEFEFKGFDFKLTHAHALIAGYLGFGCKKALIDSLKKYNVQMSTYGLPYPPSKRKLQEVISKMREISWSGYHVDDIAKIIERQIKTRNLYLVYPDEVMALRSPYLDIVINEYKKLIGVYRDDFYDIDYVRNVLRNATVDIAELTTKEKIKEYLERFSAEDDAEEPSVIIIDDRYFYTSKKDERDEIKRILRI